MVEFSSKKSFIGIEFSSSLVRIVKGPQGGSIESLKVLDSFKIAALDDHAIGFKIKKVIAKYSADKIVIFVPRRSVLLRFLELPSTDEKELRSMVDLQLERHLPYAVDEMQYDIAVSKSEQKGCSHVVLAALHKKEVNRIVSICDSAEIAPDLLTLSSWGTYTAYRNLPKQSGGYSLLIDADYDETEFILTNGQTIIMTRSISHNPDYQEAGLRGEFLEHVYSELKTTIDTAKDTYKFDKIDLLVLGPSLASFEVNFKEVFSSMSQIQCYANLNSMNSHCLQIEPRESLFSVLGMLTLIQGKAINFLPKTIVKNSLRREASLDRKLTYVFGALIFLTIIGGIIGLFGSRIGYIESVEKQLRAMDPEATKVSRTVKKIKIIDQIRHGQIVPLEAIRELYSIVPAEMYLTILEYDADLGITIRGYASKLGSVSDFLLVLQKSAYFQNAEIKFAKQKQVKNFEGVDFEIYCPYFIVKESL